MRQRAVLMLIAVVALATPLVALNPGSDVLVPAAARAGSWVTDLYVMNPGDAAVDGTIYWLVRDQANTDPVSISFQILPGETMVMADILHNDFGYNQAAGAFRVVGDGQLVVNSRIYSSDGAQTFGQGFEGVPVEAAIGAGQTADVVGLSHVSQVFRTNFYALAGPNGASISLALIAPDGSEIASGTLDFEAYEPYLKRINQAIPSGDFAEGTLRVTVASGSIVAGASKVDEASTDPTTLESSTPLGAVASVDGTYEITLTDSEGYASGGEIVIEDGVVTAIQGSYANWDKDGDTDGEADCPLLFQWGAAFPETDVTAMAGGVSFTDSYAATGSGSMAWTVSFTATDGTTLSGTVSAVGSGFPTNADPSLDESGCDGTFPALTLQGGKVN